MQGIYLGLHRIRAMMQALGNPQQKFPALHIAGTNGKGSVAAMSESILRHGGRRTALYTSPDLVRVEERICVAGRPISPRRFASMVDRVRAVETELVRRSRIDRCLTYFEFITAGAFLHFSEEKIDIAVVEVGLGGALDATNVVCPRACVITGISYDHQNLLGNTLAEIAGEKAGIIKQGVPVVSGCRPIEARRVIRRKARLAHAPLIEIDRDCTLRIVEDRRGFCTIDLETPRWRSRPSRPSRILLLRERLPDSAWLARAGPEDSMNTARSGGLSWRARIIPRGLRNCASSC